MIETHNELSAWIANSPQLLPALEIYLELMDVFYEEEDLDEVCNLFLADHNDLKHEIEEYHVWCAIGLLEVRTFT